MKFLQLIITMDTCFLICFHTSSVVKMLSFLSVKHTTMDDLLEMKWITPFQSQVSGPIFYNLSCGVMYNLCSSRLF